MTQEVRTNDFHRLRGNSRVVGGSGWQGFAEVALSFSIVVETSDNLATLIDTLSVIEGAQFRCSHIRYEVRSRGGFLVLEVEAEAANRLTPAIDRIRGLANVCGCCVLGMGRPNSD